MIDNESSLINVRRRYVVQSDKRADLSCFGVCAHWLLWGPIDYNPSPMAGIFASAPSPLYLNGVRATHLVGWQHGNTRSSSMSPSHIQHLSHIDTRVTIP